MISKGDKIIIFSIVGLAIILLFIFWKDVKSSEGTNPGSEKVKNEGKGKKDGKKNGKDAGATNVSDVLILVKWDLPDDLKEVSGIAYLDDQRFACIQDEKGTVFIYNKVTNKIEKEISFAGPGDFEGITVEGDMVYIMRADGKIFEVDMKIGKSSVKEYSTLLTAKHNVEGLCYDKNNDRLLLAIKDDEPSNPGYKGIYAFDLSKKVFIKEPVFKIDLQDEMIANQQDKKNKSIMPSSIGINPVTNEIFITDGPKSKLLIMDKSGMIKKTCAIR